jgi:HlyD family secretion protein
MRFNRIFHLGLVAFSILLIAASCHNGDDVADAYGNFQSDEIIISAQNTGELIIFSAEEGEQLDIGDLAGIIDTIPVVLQRKQLLAQKNTLGAKRDNIQSQADVQTEQLKNLERETRRLESLYRGNAATDKQYEDMKGNLNVAKAQLLSIETQFKSVLAESQVLDSQLKLLENQLSKCKIINPVKGVVLEKYVNKGELVTVGKSLYKIANLDEMQLKVYVSGNQLSDIKIGDTVDVFIDREKREMMMFPGKVSWISSEVEFTPKIIQTREERVNMVYGVKVKVKNDGSIKIGMPGEVKFK